MKKTFNRLLSLSLACAMLLSMGVSAFASDYNEMLKQGPDYFTEENLAKVEEHNQMAEAYLQNKLKLRAGESKHLTVPLYMQETTYSCGAASTRMVLASLGKKYSEATLRGSDYLQTDADKETIVWKMTKVLNDLLGAGTYMHKAISQYDFGSNLILSIDKDKPVICSVKASELPHYYNNKSFAGHYVVSTGYRYGMFGATSGNDVYFSDPNYDTRYFGTHFTDFSIMSGAIRQGNGFIVMAA